MYQFLIVKLQLIFHQKYPDFVLIVKSITLK